MLKSLENYHTGFEILNLLHKHFTKDSNEYFEHMYDSVTATKLMFHFPSLRHDILRQNAQYTTTSL